MKKIIVLLACLSFYFCHSLMAEEVGVVNELHSGIPVPAKDKAQIVFLKPIEGIMAGLPVQIFEIKNAEREFFGVMETKSKLIVNVEPGKHLFMSTMVNFSHFMDTDLVAGKRYYVLVRFIYANGFQLRPIKTNGPADYSPANPQFNVWKAQTTDAKKTPANEKYASKQAKRVARSQEKSWKTWQAKTPAQRAELSLKKEDFLD